MTEKCLNSNSVSCRFPSMLVRPEMVSELAFVSKLLQLHLGFAIATCVVVLSLELFGFEFEFQHTSENFRGGWTVKVADVDG